MHGSSQPLVFECVCARLNERPLYSHLGCGEDAGKHTTSGVHLLLPVNYNYNYNPASVLHCNYSHLSFLPTFTHSIDPLTSATNRQ